MCLRANYESHLRIADLNTYARTSRRRATRRRDTVDAGGRAVRRLRVGLKAGSCEERFVCLFQVCAVLPRQARAGGSVFFCRQLSKAGLHGPAASEKNSESIKAPFIIPFEPVVHQSFRLHETCCRLTDALLAHANHVHGKDSNQHPGIFFAPVCLFEIVLICLSHNTSEIGGSRNLSVRGLNLKRIFACSYSTSSDILSRLAGTDSANAMLNLVNISAVPVKCITV